MTFPAGVKPRNHPSGINLPGRSGSVNGGATERAEHTPEAPAGAPRFRRSFLSLRPTPVDTPLPTGNATPTQAGRDFPELMERVRIQSNGAAKELVERYGE